MNATLRYNSTIECINVFAKKMRIVLVEKKNPATNLKALLDKFMYSAVEEEREKWKEVVGKEQSNCRIK